MVIVSDATQPSFKECSEKITVHPHACSNETIVHFPYPKVSDNSDKDVIVSGYFPKRTLQIGTHFITYYATDHAGNEVACKFQVQVAPVVCPALVKSLGLLVADISCGNTFGSVVCFKCEHGLRLHGDHCIECKANSHWSNDVPTCVCPPPLKKMHGRYQDENPCETGAPIGSTCKLVCEDGYKVKGPDETTCKPDGSWSVNGNKMACKETFSGRYKLSFKLSAGAKFFNMY